MPKMPQRDDGSIPATEAEGEEGSGGAMNKPCRFTRAGHFCVEHNQVADPAEDHCWLGTSPEQAKPAPDLTATLRSIATPVRLHYCAHCVAPIPAGCALTSVRAPRQTLCPACALEEAAEIAVHALTLHEPEIDLLTLQRASALLTTCAAMFAADVGARRKRAEAKGGMP
jgi:hypothetical protein